MDEDDDFDEATPQQQANALKERLSAKTPVLAHLFAKYQQTGKSIVFHQDVFDAIDATDSSLKKSNPANFLKDVIRKEIGNSWWPAEAKTARITARQRYGERMVMQFIPYKDDQELPFPDNFVPDDKTPIYEVQTATVPHLARALGRKDEAWLTQAVVNLRIIESHFSLFSPVRDRLREITHLQMGMKTQPEIDATFVLSLGKAGAKESERNVFLTCEAKQLDERILEDQIRSQVQEVMKKTKTLKSPAVHAVRPLALQVLVRQGERFIYLVEFEEYDRVQFDEKWANRTKYEERLYDMPLVRVAHALYRLRPPLRGINS